MVKIGAKLVKNHKTIGRTNYINDNNYNRDCFYDYLNSICHSLDIANPIVTEYHISDYEKFNFVKFDQTDFIDKQNFDYLLLENDDR